MSYLSGGDSAHSWTHLIAAGVLALTLLFAGTSRVLAAVSLNLARSTFYRALWTDDHSAERRQRALARVEYLLAHRTAGGSSATGEDTGSSSSMVPSMIRADYSLRQGDLSAAMWWTHRAIHADPCPPIQPAIAIPDWITTNLRGDLAIAWSAAAWSLRSDSDVADLTVSRLHRRLRIHHVNIPRHRDRVILQYGGPLPSQLWHALQVKARVQKGAFLNIETHTAAGVERHISYHPGTGEWEEFSIPLADDQIRWIYISLNEPTVDSAPVEYTAEIEPLVLLLDGRARLCEQ